MTEKRYLNIIPTGHIIDTKNDTVIRGSGISDLLNEQEERIKELEQEKELIKQKILQYILNYNKIATDNWNLGLSESVETMEEEVKALFNNPTEWEYMFSCDECKHFKAEEDNYDKAYCMKLEKVVDYFNTSNCKEFEWK